MADRIEDETRVAAAAGLAFLDEVRDADGDGAHAALSAFSAGLGFDVTESWRIEMSGGSAEERLQERRTLVPEAEAGIIYLLDRGDPAFAWAASQGRPWLMHPHYALPLPDDSEAEEAIRASHEIVPSRMNFAIPSRRSIRLTSVSSDMPLVDLQEAERRHAFSFALACFAVLSRAEAGGQAADPAPWLTPRERECLTLLAAGHRNTAIAYRLSITESTVEMHIANARRKLGARTREQALVEALRLRLIAP